MAWKGQAEMEAAAREAEKDLQNVPPAAVATVAEWWGKWWQTAGHKRLGRMLVKIDEAQEATSLFAPGDPEDLPHEDPDFYDRLGDQ